MPKTTKRKPRSDTREFRELQELVARARSGDESVLPELKKALDENSRIWQQVGDLHKHVEEVWLDVIGQRDVLVKECVRRELRRMRRKLQADCASVLEKHLVNQILASFLQTKHAELCLAAVDGGPIRQREHYARRVDQCNRRYSTAIGQLLQIRELLGKGRETAKTPKMGSKNANGLVGAAKTRKAAKKRRLRVVSA